MNQSKHSAIQQYLADSFPGCGIEQRHDFDRGAQTFKVQVPDGTLLLKVGDEFIADNNTSELLHLFKQWSLAETLGKEKGLGVLVSQRGLEVFKRGT